MFQDSPTHYAHGGDSTGMYHHARHRITTPSSSDPRKQLMMQLVEGIRKCRPEWGLPAVEAFADQIEAQVHAASSSVQHYCDILSARIVQLARVASAATVVPRTPTGEEEAEGDDAHMGTEGTTGQRHRRASIQKCVSVLGHAFQCHDASCKEVSCLKMKEVIAHSVQCKIPAPHCGTCRQLAVLCRMHRAECESEAHCHVPTCSGEMGDAMEE
eukprot:m.86795 g.86795  ORF g.86795 m.86795 type:complete len:214 (-) comp9679_c0_seq1:136-777(-)